MGLKHGPKAIGEVFEEFALFLFLGSRMGLTRVMRRPKNTSYSRHNNTIKSILQYRNNPIVKYFSNKVSQR